MGRRKRNTVQTISNAIARIVLATGTQNSAAGTSGSNTGGTCIRVASAGTHQSYYDKHHHGATDALKGSAAKLFCTPASDVIIAGSPSASSVVNAFEAASVHSELGKMLKSFASASVDLFVKGPESVTDFAEKWIAQMSGNSAQKYLYELQGFGTLFSFLYYQVVQARKKYLDALKKAMLPNSVESIDVLMQTLENLRDMLLQPPPSDDDGDDEDATDGAASGSDDHGSVSSRRRGKGGARRHNNADGSDSVATADRSTKSSVHLTPQQPPMDSASDISGSKRQGRAPPRRQQPQNANSALHSFSSSQQASMDIDGSTGASSLHKQQSTQVATSVFQFGGTLQGGGDRRGLGRAEKLPRLVHAPSAQSSAQQQQLATESPSAHGLQVPVSLGSGGAADREALQPTAVALTTATSLLSYVQQHHRPSPSTNSIGGPTDQQLPLHQPRIPLGDVGSLHVGVAALKSMPLALHEGSVAVVKPHHPPRPLGVDVPYQSSTLSSGGALGPYSLPLGTLSSTAHQSRSSHPPPFHGPPLPLTARSTGGASHRRRDTPDEHTAGHSQSARGWREYWENEENKKLQQTISGCRNLVNYGRERDLTQYGRDLEVMRREVYGEDKDLDDGRHRSMSQEEAL